MDATVRPRATVNATTEVEGENMLRGVLIAVCMTACNKEAGTLKLEGDARKKFMSEYLPG
jgi:psiF repeat